MDIPHLRRSFAPTAPTGSKHCASRCAPKRKTLKLSRTQKLLRGRQMTARPRAPPRSTAQHSTAQLSAGPPRLRRASDGSAEAARGTAARRTFTRQAGARGSARRAAAGPQLPPLAHLRDCPELRQPPGGRRLPSERPTLREGRRGAAAAGRWHGGTLPLTAPAAPSLAPARPATPPRSPHSLHGDVPGAPHHHGIRRVAGPRQLLAPHHGLRLGRLLLLFLIFLLLLLQLIDRVKIRHVGEQHAHLNPTPDAASPRVCAVRREGAERRAPGAGRGGCACAPCARARVDVLLSAAAAHASGAVPVPGRVSRFSSLPALFRGARRC